MKILRNLMCLSTSAFLLTACNGGSGSIKEGAVGGGSGEGEIQTFFVSAPYAYYGLPAVEFLLDPQTVIPSYFTALNWSDRYDFAQNEVVNPTYDIRQYSIQNTQLKISNNGASDLIVSKIEVNPHDPLFGTITLDPISYPLTIRAHEFYSIDMTNLDCGDSFKSEAIKVSIESDAKDYPDFNSDLIIHCGY